MSHQYFITYKAFQVLSQFSPSQGKNTLSEYCKVPGDIYPIGRLDYDSEGLLILSNDPGLNHRLLDPSFGHEREYWVQVEGQVTPAVLRELSVGVTISLDGKPYRTKPSVALDFSEAPTVPERVPPIRFRKHIPTSWIRLMLTEGKNRQVRRMTAAVGFPTLRLIRYRIGGLRLDGLQPGDCRNVSRETLYNALFG
jgi:23S rRNA pseudouridine2457 synthase